MKIRHSVVSIVLGVFISYCFAQEVITNPIEKVIKTINEDGNRLSDLTIKVVDLDNDNDEDYLFSYICGEPMCLKIYLNDNGLYKKVIDEFGYIEFEYSDSIKGETSKLIVNSLTRHCCGESPFPSYRSFSFSKDNVIIENNYVSYDYKSYSDEVKYLTLTPSELFKDPYEVKINAENYNARFSADLDYHSADFTCFENTNVIAQLIKGKVVKVIGESKGDDYKERTWLYVEIPDQAIKISDVCPSPISYDFSNQKLNAWISSKYVEKI
ncbi:hypothetical protein [Marinomonas sp.]|uniref:hypothetical protein n=1 Tax=Marinomonas sp. TaxID=1904862 RepID=UPI003BABF8B2